MQWLTARLFRLLGRLLFFAAPRLLGRPYTEELSSRTVMETRRTETSEKKSKKRP